MSNNTVFTEYPAIAEITSDTNPTTKKSDCNKKFKKQLKKQNRLLKQLLNLIERRTTAEQPAAEEAHTKKNSFLTKLGDAFVKALPAILSTVATAIIRYFAAKPHAAACSAGRW